MTAKRSEWVIVAVPVAVIALVWVGFVIARQPRDQEAQQLGLAEPAIVRLGKTEDDLAQSGELSFEWATERTIGSPASGVITEVPTDMPDTVAALEGRPVIGIDGILRIGSHYAFYREITWGTEGPDVAALNLLLSSQGLDADPAIERFNDATARAVRAFRTSIGAAPSSTFDPSLVVFLPASGMLDDLAVAYGDQVQTGDAIAVLRPGITTVSLSLTGTPDRQALLRRGTQIEITANSGVVVLDDLSLDDAALDQISALVEPGAESLDVQLRLVAPLIGSAIPSGALSVASDGATTCLLEVGVDGALAPSPVVTRASIQPGIRIGDRSLIGRQVMVRGSESSDPDPVAC